jgi:hypothetical protein
MPRNLRLLLEPVHLLRPQQQCVQLINEFVHTLLPPFDAVSDQKGQFGSHFHGPTIGQGLVLTWQHFEIEMHLLLLRVFAHKFPIVVRKHLLLIRVLEQKGLKLTDFFEQLLRPCPVRRRDNMLMMGNG